MISGPVIVSEGGIHEEAETAEVLRLDYRSVQMGDVDAANGQEILSSEFCHVVLVENR